MTEKENKLNGSTHEKWLDLDTSKTMCKALACQSGVMYALAGVLAYSGYDNTVWLSVLGLGIIATGYAVYESHKVKKLATEFAMMRKQNKEYGR